MAPDRHDQLDDIEDQLAAVTGGGDGDDGPASPNPDPEALDVEWRNADPEHRPEGVSFDPDSGTLTYDVWSAQQDALDALNALAVGSDGEPDADIVAFLAGYGTGKSVSGARWLIAQAFAYPGGHFLAMGQSFSEARTSTFEKLFEALPGERTALRTSSFNGPESSPLVADYNRAEHRLTLVNDAVITLGSADKWSRFAGAEFGGAWLDEPSHYGSDLHDLLEMMGSRLRGVAGPKVMFWTLTGAGYNAAYEILAQRQDANGEPIGLNIDVIRASTLDNPYLDEADKERFKRQYVGTGREEQALEGGFAAARGLVYDDFRRDTHVIPHGEARERIDPEWRIFGYDAGWSDPRVLLEIGKTGYGQLVILDEYHQSNSHVDGAIRWLQGHNKPQRTIFAEHEPADIERFRQAGWRTVKAAKSLDAGIAEVQKRLRTEGADDVAATPGDGSAGATVRPPRVTKPYTGSAGSGSSRSSSSKSSTTTSSGVGPTPDPVPASELTSDGPDADAEPESGQGQGQGSGRFGLLVAANCEHLIQEFLSYKTEHVGTSQAADHCLDSLRYAYMGIAGNVNGDGGGRPKRQTIPSTW